MTRIIILTASILLLMVSSSYAQHSVALQYSLNFPTGNTSDYIGNVSPRGATLDYRYRIMPDLSVGFSTAWYSFYEEKSYDTYTSSNGAIDITGKQYRYINSSPLLFTVDYYLATGETISPFIGLGIGTTYNRLDTDIGLYEIEQESWQFTLAPEVGIQVPFADALSGYLSLRYNNSFETADLDKQAYLTLNIGLLLGSN